MSQNKTVLGKGLASLLPGLPSSVPSVATGAVAGFVVPPPVNKDRQMGISMAKADQIVPNPHQPRREFDEQALQELSQSIKENGIIQPLVVRKTETGYELIAGERRLRAAKLAGLEQVPIVVRRSTDKESLEVALIENIQRRDLNCVDEALAYFQLIEEFGLTQEGVAKQVGKDRATVANHLRLLNLPEVILEGLKKEEISLGHAKAILSLETVEDKLKLWKELSEKKLSVREAEKRAAEIKEGNAETTFKNQEMSEPASDSEKLLKQRLRLLSNDLCRKLAIKAQVRGSAEVGTVVFHYKNSNELNRLVESLLR
jgi:ParB family transcriptional regulator, chromosome partitioning protein